tara:strand:- start:6067 stop:6765 length:699 start_codon:yes stop_codon:yes gene_type:complete
MNTLAFVLGIVIVILIYILYKFFSQKPTTLVDTSSLNEQQDPITIKNSPTSTKYSYGVWIYINSWYTSSRASTNTGKKIFARANNVELYFENNSPVLKCRVTTENTGDETAASSEDFVVTNNFPLQKWTQVILSADNQYFDCYIDGKLLTSVRISNPSIPASTATMLLGGGTLFDAYVSKFQHWSEAISPQTAYESYLAGNGQTSLFQQLASYGLDLTILKDNIEYSKFNLF